MRRRFGWGLLLVSTLPVGCAAQYEEPSGTQPDSAREQRQAEPAAMEAPVAAGPADAADRELEDLDDIALELASNEAKLRALGIQLPSRTSSGGGETSLGREADEVAAEPDSRPSTAPAPTPPKGESGTSSKQGQGRRDNKPAKKKNEDKDGSERFAPPPGGRAEEAKAAPLSPTEQPKLDAATRCIQVCELSEITCELGVQICELAQRHAQDRDYEQACARATEDCDAAQEACDVCAG